MNIIECQNISICYGQHTALKQLSFNLAAGECLGLVGLNGAGKTSLLKALLDFIEIQSGQIQLFGQPHTQAAARTELAFLPEHFVPDDYLYGHEFLQYLLRLYHVPPALRGTEQIQHMSQALDLNPQQLHQRVRSYSKGARQKLGLIACFLSQKHLLILDEPMSGLDPKARALAREQIKQHQHAGNTLLFSAHHLEDVGQLCDRLLVIHEGQAAFIGTPQTFLQQFGGENLEQAFLRCIDTEHLSENKSQD